MPVDHAILLAFGPRRTTTDAVERLKAMMPTTARIVVVAAVRQGTRPLGALRSQRVEVAREVGRAGLAAALASADAASTVLLTHDDVLVSRASLEAMAATHARTGAITTAWSNDTDQPNFCGALPPTRHAAGDIEATRPKVGEQIVPTLRPACLVTTADALRDMLPMRLTVARTLLRSADQNLVVAAGAVVAHDSTCVDQVAPPRSPDARPLVTAALIVRDEEAMLPGCLESLRGFADRVVVCDTGSTDGTIEVARAHGAEVITRSWRKDFGWARNEVLDVCRDAWYVLQIDADERLDCDAEEIRRLLATDVDDSTSFTIRIRNLDDLGRTALSHLATRLFRPDGIEYVGALHEMPVRSDGAPLEMTRLDGIELEHHGYTTDVVHARGKRDRNLDIAQTEHAEAPTPLTAMNLARALLSDPTRGQEAEALLAWAIETGLPLVPRAHALAMMGNQALRNGDAARARVLADEALDLVPADDAAGQAHAEASLALNEFTTTVERARARRHASSPDAYSTSTVARAREMLAVARAYVAMDDLGGAATAVSEALATGRVLGLDAWLDLVAILVLADPAPATDRLVAAAASDDTGDAIEAIAATLPGVEAARLAARVVAAGSVTPASVRVGLAAAVVTGDQPVLDLLLPHAHLLEPAVTERLMEVAAAKGRDLVTTRLASTLLAHSA